MDWIDRAGKQYTTPVGAYSRQGDGPWGCVDMAGNVWGWTAGEWEPGSARRVVHGGSFNLSRRSVHCAYRDRDVPDYLYGSLGFRPVAVSIDPERCPCSYVKFSCFMISQCSSAFSVRISM